MQSHHATIVALRSKASLSSCASRADIRSLRKIRSYQESPLAAHSYSPPSSPQCYKTPEKRSNGKVKNGTSPRTSFEMHTTIDSSPVSPVVMDKLVLSQTVEDYIHHSIEQADQLKELSSAWDRIQARNAHEPEFLQAVEEVMETMKPVFLKNPEYIPVFERMAEPERMIMFRVPWTDDTGKVQVNRGFRVQFNSTLGPYKGGLRFHPSVNLSVIKFLGFEQILKNSLTTLPIGGGKGGSDFDPKGKSDAEVMRFCQSFMTELCRHIGADTDIPAGDIGVGAREVGYLFGMYKRLRNEFTGTLTGKGLAWGGSNIRPEATGYGTVYFTQEMLHDADINLKGMRVAVSGSGNVAQFAVEKLLELGAVPISMSDSKGTIYEPDGITSENLKAIMELKNIRRGRLSEYPSISATGMYLPGLRPWSIPSTQIDVAMPCATQNELNEEEANALVSSGCMAVSEGANMPCTPAAIEVFHLNGVMFAPAKAANAGGVAVSGLEMSQNSQRLHWTREEVDDKLQAIMKNIYASSKSAASEYEVSLQAGANIAGFVKVAESMIAQGCV